MGAQILVVDDDEIILDLVERALQKAGYDVLRAGTKAEAMEIMTSETVEGAVLDFNLPDGNGQQLCQELRATKSNLPVLFITGSPSVEQAVALMKLGGCDYLTKPLSPPLLISRLEQVIQLNKLATEVEFLRSHTSSATEWAPGGFLTGKSPVMRALEEQLRTLAQFPQTTVLLTGPTGVGKSVAAAYLHRLTCGEKAPFVDIDCSTIPRELCESELFGHEKGSFTGAHRAKPGLFEVARDGTAFLDEIGELDAPLQTKLLRVVESRIFKRVGGQAPMKMSARVIAATNRPLEQMVRDGKFREDLYYRLSVAEISLPALRERGEDVSQLAQEFLKFFASQYNKPVTGFSPPALDFLLKHPFPGNVRELRNLIERAVIYSRGEVLDFRPESGAIPAGLESEAPVVVAHSAPSTESLNVAENERRALVQALAQANGNKSEAAKLAGLSRFAFLRRLKKYNLETEDSPLDSSADEPDRL